MTLTTLIDVAVSSDIVLKLSYLDAVQQQELDLQKSIVNARNFHIGKQDVKLTDRLKEFLEDPSEEFRLNICSTVVTAMAERLIVNGFNCDDLEVLDWAWRIWETGGLATIQEEVHEGALRDGEYFVIVSWDDEESRPVFVPHERYTTIEAGGNGYGCQMFYEQDDPNQKPQFAMKQWVEATGRTFVEYRNLYYPDRVEMYSRGGTGDWERIREIDWTDSEGKPLGIAVKHFKNKHLQMEASNAIPLQRGVNKSLLDLMAAADLTAFRIFVSLGFIPTTDGGAPKEDRSNWLQIQPGHVVGTTKSPSEASFDAIDSAELAPMLDATHQLILWAAMTTSTPVTRFVSTKLIASDETLKEQEGPLLARITSRQKSFGRAWTEVMELAAKLENEYGEEGTELNTEAKVIPIWIEPQSRSLREKLDLLEIKRRLGVPLEQLWREMGYTERQIEVMRSEREAVQEQFAQTQNQNQEQEQEQEQDREVENARNTEG